MVQEEINQSTKVSVAYSCQLVQRKISFCRALFHNVDPGESDQVLQVLRKTLPVQQPGIEDAPLSL